MEDIVVEVDNIDDALESLDLVGDLILEKIGIKAKAYAQFLCPVDTSNLKNSIDYTVEAADKEDVLMVGTNVFYAPYVELGTYKMKARPYLRPAFEDHMDEYKQIIEDALQSS